MPGLCRLYPLPQNHESSPPSATSITHFFGSVGVGVSLLWNSQLFSMYCPVEDITLGTDWGVCRVFSPFSPGKLTVHVGHRAFLWAKCLKHIVGSPEISKPLLLWDPCSHLWLLVWTQLWFPNVNPERGQCAQWVFRSSGTWASQTFSSSPSGPNTALWLSGSLLKFSHFINACSESYRIWLLIVKDKSSESPEVLFVYLFALGACLC